MQNRLQDEIKQTKPFRSIREEAFLQLARTMAVITHSWEQAIRGYGITLTQYNVLRILRGAGEKGLCRHEVAGRLVTQVPDVSRLLDRMLRAGLLTRTRDKNDRRLVNAVITPKGLAILEKLDEPSQSMIEEQLRHMGDDEIRTLNELLDKARHP